jgi:hypothetical protein
VNSALSKPTERAPNAMGDAQANVHLGLDRTSLPEAITIGIIETTNHDWCKISIVLVVSLERRCRKQC